MKFVGKSARAHQTEVGKIALEYGLTNTQPKSKIVPKKKRTNSETKIRKIIEPAENSQLVTLSITKSPVKPTRDGSKRRSNNDPPVKRISLDDP